MRDLWNDLARRVQEADRVELGVEHGAEQSEMPFGFVDAVMRKLEVARRAPTNSIEQWIAVLRPAVGLAFGTALVCILLQLRLQHETPNATTTANDAVAQTEQLFQLALAND
jgi:hypothetical protein